MPGHQYEVTMCLTVKKLPSEVLEFLKAQGAKSERIGGKAVLGANDGRTASRKGYEGQQGGCGGEEGESQEDERERARKRVASRHGPVT